jgi:transcription elongation factor Elf1
MNNSKKQAIAATFYVTDYEDEFVCEGCESTIMVNVTNMMFRLLTGLDKEFEIVCDECGQRHTVNNENMFFN